MVLEDMCDLLLASDSPQQLFKPIRSLPVVVAIFLLDVAVLITAFTLPHSYAEHTDGHPSLFSILLYLQCILWASTVIADQVLSKQHQKSLLRGYLEFNRKIVPLLRSILITVTSCSILMLTIAAIAWDYCPREGTCSVAVPLTPANYAQIVISLQTSLLLPVCLAYSVRVHQFNSCRSMPDIFEGQMVYSLPRSLPAFEDVGIRDSSAETLLEKQAEAIHFLKEHNSKLSRKILSLTDQLGNGAQVTA